MFLGFVLDFFAVALFLLVEPGTFKTLPIDRLLFVRSFAFFKSFTEMPNFTAT